MTACNKSHTDILTHTHTVTLTHTHTNTRALLSLPINWLHGTTTTTAKAVAKGQVTWLTCCRNMLPRAHTRPQHESKRACRRHRRRRVSCREWQQELGVRWRTRRPTNETDSRKRNVTLRNVTRRKLCLDFVHADVEHVLCTLATFMFDAGREQQREKEREIELKPICHKHFDVQQIINNYL